MVCLLAVPAAADEIVWEYSTGLSHPWDADRLSNGNTLISDAYNDRIIEVTPSGTIAWEYNAPKSVNTADRLSNGNTLICEYGGTHRVMEVTPGGTIAWEYPCGDCCVLAAHRLSNGNTLISDSGRNRVIEVTPDSAIVWEYSTGLHWPVDARRLPDGNTLIADSQNNRVIEVNSSGTIVWEYSTVSYTSTVQRLSNGNTLIASWQGNCVIEVTPGGTIVWEYSTGLNQPHSAHRLSNGNTLIADEINNRVIEVGAPPAFDFGDAPDPTYPSLLASDGARHSETDTEFLGLQSTGDGKDFEPDAKIIDADLLDDGLVTSILATENPAQTVDFEVTNMIVDDTLLVNILLDLNGDGDWNDVVGTQSEHVVQNQAISLPGIAEGVFTSDSFSTVGATDGATRMRITLTRQPINAGWNGTMASAGYAEPFGCGETEDWEVELVKIIPEVETATGSGTATFESTAGTIVDLTAVAESAMPDAGKPDLMYPHGFFSFNITGLANGQTVDVTVTLPADVPVGTQYWKCIDSAWVQIPIGSDDGDNVITIQLTDGGPGDSDGLEDGTIVEHKCNGYSIGISV
jgi:hypothetical protein